MMSLQWFDLIGFLGVFMVLGAYGGHQTRKLRADGALYSLVNLFGAAAILVPVLYAPSMNWSVIFIEVAWMAISAYGLYQTISRRFSRVNA